MNKENVKKIVEYWQKTAEHDYETMTGLFKIKRYSDSLFFGHIVLEKILKAHVVYDTKEHAPKIHDLIELTKLAKHNLLAEDIKILNTTNKFNIRCRYPDFKLKFYKSYNNPEYSSEKIKEIKKMYTKLCEMLEKKMK